MVGKICIEDLPIPFTAVATDLTNQQEIWFQEGSLSWRCAPPPPFPACSPR